MKKGFTFMELMIVIAILAVLTAMITGNFLISLKKGRDARRKADLEQVQRAVELYYEDKRSYPNWDIFAAGNTKLCETQACGGSEKVYMETIPNDPSYPNRNYTYMVRSADDQAYKMFACLENTQQVLSYDTITDSPGCSTKCKSKSGSAADCVWPVTSPNINLDKSL
ncbi:prepilin-type N-terminal cleavage/methylation domain-containing protein [Patescibacteria group bacterium]|nr:prepilin-type N-terminal cleavage/methylation domain-containing protein [Patescibacteria group bacterium]MCL5091851.1 prepilin-type N-terminal cleavage/methylation domain-containing protein [Patescibacteria group bacterium]